MEYLLNFIILFLAIILIYWKYKTRPQQQQQQQENQTHQQHNSNHQYPIKSVINPFFIDIDNIKSSLENGIFFKLIVNIKCHFIVAWSIDIQKFYQDLDKNFLEKFHDTNLLVNNSMIISKNEIIENNELKEYHLKTPEQVKETHLSSINSVVQKYPLVIALYRTKDSLSDSSLNETDIVASLWIVHLKDTKTNTKTLFVYSKFFNDKIIHMKKLYAQESENCIVCLSEASTQVLLPCKHLCVCNSCYIRLDNNCPLCRKPIIKTFKIQ